MTDNPLKRSSLRIIDAAYNRAREGLRVVEDCLRMHVGDRMLAAEIKQVRHDLASSLQDRSRSALISRDVLNDVGTTISTQTEYERGSLDDILRANFARTLQSLRSIEEYLKLLEPKDSPDFERLRYRVYAIEKATVQTVLASKTIEGKQLYVLVDGCDSKPAFDQLIGNLLEAEVDVIQLRDKRLSDRELVERGKRLTTLTADANTIWIMNDRPDLALVSKADGVHLGQDDLPVTCARSIVGPEKLIGVSSHDFDQARQAVFDGADYIGVGPVFTSQTKAFEQFADQGFLRKAANELAIPQFAIGGINADNLHQILHFGFYRVAISSGIVSAANPVAMARYIKSELQSCQEKSGVVESTDSIH